MEMRNNFDLIISDFLLVVANTC